MGPYVTRDPVGSYGTSSPCDSDTPGPTGQYVADGPVDPCVPVGPVSMCGSSSLSDPKSVILVNSGWTFPSSDVDVRWDPTIPAESASLRGPIGPVMPLRTFPQSDQVGGECMDIHGGWSGPDVVGTPPVVAAVDLRAGSTETDGSSDCADDREAWDSGYAIDSYQREIIDGVTVYYGGDSCDLEESDWEDPKDVARRECVDDYNFDLLEGMEPMVIVPGGNPSRSDLRYKYVNYLYDGNDARVSDDDSIVDSERKAWSEYCASFFGRDLVRFLWMWLCSHRWVSVGTNCYRMNRIGKIRTMLQVGNMWTITILTCLMEWS